MIFIKEIIFKFKLLLILPFLLLFTGCFQTDMKQFENNKPKLDLFSFFEGETIAYGIFEDRFGNLKRQFRVNIKGTTNNKTLTLDEDFLYDDGEKAKRIWTIEKKLDENKNITYIGSADDVEGKATGSISGNTLNWTYDIYLNIKGSNIKVHFNDWIYKQSDDLAINRAYVSKFGINIGSVTLVFLRGKTADNIGPLNLKNW
ncbi:DUF3833 domain-containing protein [Pseudomonadota bacterium]|nr:DUF3833 domain-containing protein [Alphaproteobacteria bacterium]MDC1357365.1 DUF3833 domain-containing protein [Pseudomonadota bacterium]